MFVCLALACNNGMVNDGKQGDHNHSHHREPPLRAPACGVGMGATSKWQDNSNAATRPNTMTGLGDDETMRQLEMRGKQLRGKAKGPQDVV